MSSRSLLWLACAGALGGVLAGAACGCDKSKQASGPPSGPSRATSAPTRPKTFDPDREAAELLAEQERRRLEEALERARAAIKAEDFDMAQEALREAARLAPTEASVGKLQRQLGEAKVAAAAAKKKREAEDQAKSETEEKKKEEQFRAHVKRGKEAMEEEDYLEAVEQFRAALKLYPGDSDANLLLGIAENKAGLEPNQDEAKAKAELAAKKKAAEEAKAKAAADKKTKDDKRETDAQTAKKEKAAYDRAMSAGQEAFKRKSFDEAIASFETAQKLRPGDEAAKRWIDLAKRAKEAAGGAGTKPTPPAASKPGP